MERRALPLCSLALGALLVTPAAALATPGEADPVIAPAQTKPTGSKSDRPQLPFRVTGEPGKRRLLLGKRPLLQSPELPAGPVEYEEVTLAGGQQALLVHVGEGSARFTAALLGRGSAPRVLWSGSERVKGDPGERRATKLTPVRGSEDQGAHLIVGETYDRARICGDTNKPLLLRQEVSTGAPRPYHAPRPGTGEAKSATVAVLPQAPPAPALALLSPRALSSRDDKLALDPPYEATDGRLDAAVALDHAGDFITLGYGGGDFGMAHVDVTLVGPAPHRLRVHVDGAHMDVDVPVSTPPNAVIRITPETPVQTGCLTLQRLDDSAPALKIAEIAVFSSLEANGAGVRALLDAMDGPHGVEAARVLNQAGPALVPALVSAWPELGQDARKRTIDLLARHPQVTGASALLLGALRGDDVQLREAAAATLLEMRIPAARELVASAIATPPGSPALAEQAARSGDPTLLPAILTALGSSEGETRSILVRALETLLRRTPEDPSLTATLQAFEATSPPPGIRSRVALALGRAGRAPAAAARLSTAARNDLSQQASPPFEDQWWLVQALSSSPAEAEGDAYLRGMLEGSAHWMLREAALLALHARQSQSSRAAAQAALKDSYPRVRATAVRLLAEDPGALPQLLPHLTRDRWHLVRSAAAEALPDTPELRAGLVKAISDRIDPVQVAAIERATALSMAEASTAVLERLADERESVTVRNAAARYAGRLCQVQASPLLVALVDLGIAPGAKEPAQELAIQALETLAQLGAADEVRPKLEVITDPGLRAAADQALKAPSSCRRVGTQLRL